MNSTLHFEKLDRYPFSIVTYFDTSEQNFFEAHPLYNERRTQFCSNEGGRLSAKECFGRSIHHQPSRQRHLMGKEGIT
ncbi:hypothetical protein CEXT_22341 [Caerostris extrusa]|uniref:Uncharacterized protein n=1 Tax=Caerostris extrusa TaxID=172846 RepID=A0AAV4VJ73_CAEEX|nr:hypothetical protein CEXT_22341 [Caerostris extrusa]